MKKACSVIIIIIAALVSCNPAAVKKDIDQEKPHIAVTLTFNTDMYKSIMLKKVYPTYAIWAVDTKTGATATIYVTGKAAKGAWMMADERPSSLPVWFGVRRKEKAIPEKHAVDVVTSATPSGNTAIHSWQIPERMIGKKLDIYLEGNISFDYNEFYTKSAKKGEPGYSDVNGQPSVIWLATIEAGVKRIEKSPVIAGHGHMRGDNADIDTDMSKITTAREIFQYVGIVYEPGSVK